MLVDIGNEHCPTMVQRGGGVVDITVRIVHDPDDTSDSASSDDDDKDQPCGLHGDNHNTSNETAAFLVVHVQMDVCEAMGANSCNTVAEALRPTLLDLIAPDHATPIVSTKEHASPLPPFSIAIVTNLSTQRLVHATYRIPVETLRTATQSGPEMAQRLVTAYRWARRDPWRAVTHNKGIMNGMDAVAVATGQDWRAIEASLHGWASMYHCSLADRKDAKYHTENMIASPSPGSPATAYQPLNRYWIESGKDHHGRSRKKRKGEMVDESDWFCASMCVPIAIGTRGGVVTTHPTYGLLHGMMGYPTSAQLASVCPMLRHLIMALILKSSLDYVLRWIVPEFCGIAGVMLRRYDVWDQAI